MEFTPILLTALLLALPAALHCQREHATSIVEKGGDYLLQIKANQPKLFKRAQALDRLQNTPFLSKPKPERTD